MIFSSTFPFETSQLRVLFYFQNIINVYIYNLTIADNWIEQKPKITHIVSHRVAKTSLTQIKTCKSLFTPTFVLGRKKEKLEEKERINPISRKKKKNKKLIPIFTRF